MLVYKPYYKLPGITIALMLSASLLVAVDIAKSLGDASSRGTARLVDTHRSKTGMKAAIGRVRVQLVTYGASECDDTLSQPSLA